MFNREVPVPHREYALAERDKGIERLPLVGAPAPMMKNFVFIDILLAEPIRDRIVEFLPFLRMNRLI